MYKKYLYAVVLRNGEYLTWGGKVQWYELAEAKKKLRIFDGVRLQRYNFLDEIERKGG
jgi:hypothetical protein